MGSAATGMALAAVLTATTVATWVALAGVVTPSAAVTWDLVAAGGALHLAATPTIIAAGVLWAPITTDTTVMMMGAGGADAITEGSATDGNTAAASRGQPP